MRVTSEIRDCDDRTLAEIFRCLVGGMDRETDSDRRCLCRELFHLRLDNVFFQEADEGDRFTHRIKARPDLAPLTLQDVLVRGEPVLSLSDLRLIKSLGKCISTAHADGSMFTVFGLLIYNTSIAAGLVQHDTLLTTLGRAAAVEGLSWWIEQPWLPLDIRGTIRLALDRLTVG